MSQIRYRIYTLYASVLLGYAKEMGDDGYAFSLSARATEKSKVRAALHEQQDCALFFQAMCVLHGNNYRHPGEDALLNDLADVICYVDFSNIFDRNAAQTRHAVRQKAVLNLSFVYEEPAHMYSRKYGRPPLPQWS